MAGGDEFGGAESGEGGAGGEGGASCMAAVEDDEDVGGAVFKAGLEGVPV